MAQSDPWCLSQFCKSLRRWRAVVFLPRSTSSVTNASRCGLTGRRAARCAAPSSQRRFTSGGTEPRRHTCRFTDGGRTGGGALGAGHLVFNVIFFVAVKPHWQVMLYTVWWISEGLWPPGAEVSKDAATALTDNGKLVIPWPQVIFHFPILKFVLLLFTFLFYYKLSFWGRKLSDFHSFFYL